jgi:hypothetical protein
VSDPDQTSLFFHSLTPHDTLLHPHVLSLVAAILIGHCWDYTDCCGDDFDCRDKVCRRMIPGTPSVKVSNKVSVNQFGTQQCGEERDYCVDDADCCSGLDCFAGQCVLTGKQCGQLDDACLVTSDCCTGLDCDGSVCRVGGRQCGADGDSCVDDPDCCSLNCDGGVCGGGGGDGPCGADGDSCGIDADCCNRNCDGGVWLWRNL